MKVKDLRQNRSSDSRSDSGLKFDLSLKNDSSAIEVLLVFILYFNLLKRQRQFVLKKKQKVKC